MDDDQNFGEMLMMAMTLGKSVEREVLLEASAFARSATRTSVHEDEECVCEGLAMLIVLARNGYVVEKVAG